MFKAKQLRVLPMEEKYGYLDRWKRIRYIYSSTSTIRLQFHTDIYYELYVSSWRSSI